MDVPVERRERGRHRHLAEEHRQPDQDPKPGVNGAEEEERSKSVTQQRGPGERLQTRNRGHGFVSVSMPRRAVSQNAAIRSQAGTAWQATRVSFVSDSPNRTAVA